MSARLGILLSGAGSTYANLASCIAAKTLPASIAIVISSRENAAGLDIARRLGHPTAVATTPDEVTAALRSAKVEWIAMCGYMKFWEPPAEFAGRTINVHPSLLPAFGGKGLYGARVHAAVLASGSRVSGCTVHIVNGNYDSGPILAQTTVPVLPDDDVASLQRRVQEAESRLYPQTLSALIDGRIKTSGLV